MSPVSFSLKRTTKRSAEGNRKGSRLRSYKNAFIYFIVTKTVRTVEMNLKQNSFKTVSKLFCSFHSVSFKLCRQFYTIVLSRRLSADRQTMTRDDEPFRARYLQCRSVNN